MKIFDFAIKMEQDGQLFYEKLSAGATLPGLKTIFAGLARDEQKHREILLELQAQRPPRVMQESTSLETARNIFEPLLSDRTASSGVSGDLSAYRYAMELEAESFRLYEDTAAREPNAEVKALLLRIAAEEHKHFQILENVHAFVNAPNQYLAWGEFSNLEEFRNFGRKVDE